VYVATTSLFLYREVDAENIYTGSAYSYGAVSAAGATRVYSTPLQERPF